LFQTPYTLHHIYISQRIHESYTHYYESKIINCKLFKNTNMFNNFILFKSLNFKHVDYFTIMNYCGWKTFHISMFFQMKLLKTLYTNVLQLIKHLERRTLIKNGYISWRTMIVYQNWVFDFVKDHGYWPSRMALMLGKGLV
jgi:hypothetical protein